MPEQTFFYWCFICQRYEADHGSPKRKRKAKLWTSTRKAVTERDRGCCRYCGCPTSDRWGQDRPSMDHVIPRSRGGSDHRDNLVLACFACNHRKGDRTPSEADMPLLDPGTRREYPRHKIAEGRGTAADDGGAPVLPLDDEGGLAPLTPGVALHGSLTPSSSPTPRDVQ